MKKKLLKLNKHFIAALRGDEQDFTQGSIRKAIFLLAIPTIIEMLMESVFTIVDIFFVSKLGTEAVAAVGITESLMTIVYALAVGFSTAAAALVSRRIGENNKEAASLVTGQAIILTTFISLIISIVGIFFSYDLLKMMGAEESVIAVGLGYTQISLVSNVVIMLLFTINAVFRSSGDASVAMKVLLFANGINIILDPCLIFGLFFFPKLGVEGAAIATLIGRFCGIVMQLYLIFFKNNRIKLLRQHFIINLKLIFKLVQIATGGIAQSLIATMSWLFLVSILASFGNEVVAGYTIAIRVLLFVLLPSWGFAISASTLTGQNLGAGQPERAEKSVKITAGINFIYLSFIAILLIISSDTILSWFVSESNVIMKGGLAIRVISFSLFAYSIGMVMIQAFNGAGKTQIPTFISLIAFWIVQIPSAYILSNKVLHTEVGVYLSVILGDLVVTIIGVFLFKKGNWKKYKI